MVGHVVGSHARAMESFPRRWPSTFGHEWPKMRSTWQKQNCCTWTTLLAFGHSALAEVTSTRCKSGPTPLLYSQCMDRVLFGFAEASGFHQAYGASVAMLQKEISLAVGAHTEDITCSDLCQPPACNLAMIASREVDLDERPSAR